MTQNSGSIEDDYRAILTDGTPLIDLRAPSEFAHGAVPGAINLPLLDDPQREQIGICYRQDGQAAAIALGEQLVSGPLREQRIAAWLDAAAQRPDSLLYCSRGGLRSATVQRWLSDAGQPLGRLGGGFKALRQACIAAIEDAAARTPLLILGGRTGSAKTRLISSLRQSLDLEALANHRGSAFGATNTPQPTPISFENALATTLLQRRHQFGDEATLVLEDEGRTIGRLGVPEVLHAAMQRAPLVILDVELADRSAHIWEEYVATPLVDGALSSALEARYLDATHRIKRRLGGIRHAEVGELMRAAFATDNDRDAHRRWIEALLNFYYDPMYDYQLDAKAPRIVFRGDIIAVRDYLMTRDMD